MNSAQRSRFVRAVRLVAMTGVKRWKGIVWNGMNRYSSARSGENYRPDWAIWAVIGGHTVRVTGWHAHEFLAWNDLVENQGRYARDYWWLPRKMARVEIPQPPKPDNSIAGLRARYLAARPAHAPGEE